MPPERSRLHPLTEGVATAFVHDLLSRTNFPSALTHVNLAVSGGADSLCLLHAVAAVATPREVALQVAHIDHGLRPDSADDAAHVRATSDRLRIPCTVVRVDVAEYRRQHPTVTSLEAAARMLRYYRDLCAQDGCTEFHMRGITNRIDAFEQFQELHIRRTA